MFRNGEIFRNKEKEGQFMKISRKIFNRAAAKNKIGVKSRADYQLMYDLLFNAVTSALIHLKNSESKKAEKILESAQCKTEEIFINVSCGKKQPPNY